MHLETKQRHWYILRSLFSWNSSDLHFSLGLAGESVSVATWKCLTCLQQILQLIDFICYKIHKYTRIILGTRKCPISCPCVELLLRLQIQPQPKSNTTKDFCSLCHGKSPSVWTPHNAFEGSRGLVYWGSLYKVLMTSQAEKTPQLSYKHTVTSDLPPLTW